MFTHDNKELEFLFVSSLHRENGIVKNLINKIFSSFKLGEQIYVTTFRYINKKV